MKSSLAANPVVDRIKTLYRKLPGVTCKGCGKCCVSPTCTLAEFIYLMVNCTKHLSTHKLERFILTSPTVNDAYEGNTSCAMLAENRCLVHPWRTGACRLFGIPAVEKLGIANLVSCYNNCTTTGKSVDEMFIRQWLAELVAVNETLYPIRQGPYYPLGFNVACWLDIYFDTTISEETFVALRTIMREEFDLSHFASRYNPKTGLKEKIDTISLLNMIIDQSAPQDLKQLLLSIQNDFPLTGTYFYHEAQLFLDALNASR